MANYALSLSSSTYKNHILQGLAQLQQSEKFVDMTLAAEGHWVKVHQTVVALASPYFRELLQSMPAQHPVIYLYGVSHEALGFILEYMYTGQVEIPADKVQSFLNTAQDMQIAGLKNVAPPYDKKTTNQESQNKNMFHNSGEPTSSATINSTANNKNVSDLLIQRPTIVIPLVENKDKEHDKFFSINVPTSSDECEACQDNRLMNESSNLINMTLDKLAATSNDISQKPEISEFQNTTNISEPSEAINITVADSTLTNGNIRQIRLGDIFENAIIANAPGKEIKINSDNSTALNDNISNHCLPTTNTVQNISNNNGPGKMINITLDATANNEDVSHKPVARIEILSNTLVNSSTGVNFTGQGQLPELDTEALTSNVPTDRFGCSSQMDISKLLDFRDDPMDEGNSFETSAQGRSIGKNADMIHTGDIVRGEVNEVVQRGKHTDPVSYTISNRGALQLIMNRFIYYCHYERDEGRKKRWRCIDYRDRKCLAAIDTFGEDIVERKHKHWHPNHDEKIKRKLAKDKLKVFSTIQMAQKFTKKSKKKLSLREELI